MQLQQVEKIKDSQKKRAYHEEKIKVALEKNEAELSRKREALITYSNEITVKNWV